MIHVIPINDLKEHEEESTCHCSPRLIMENEEMIMVHNSFDGREKQSVMTTKMLNGIEVKHFDVIFHTTVTRFGIYDRIKILLGCKVTIRSDIYTMHEHCSVVGSEARTSVEILFPRKKGGDYCAFGETAKLEK